MKACPACGSADVDEAWACASCGFRPVELDGILAFAPHLALENRGYHADYFEPIAAIEAGSWWFQARNELIAWAIARSCPDVQRYLEIGAGTGFVLRRVAAVLGPTAELWGSEVFTAGVSIAAARNPGVRFVQMDARGIPFRDHFDLIGAFDVLEHLEDDRAAIAGIRAALRPGGAFALTVPQHPALWSRQDDGAGHVRRYVAADLRAKLAEAGFRIVLDTSFVTLLIPLMAVTRARIGRARPTEDAAAFNATEALRQPALINAILGPVMTVERRLIRLGWRPPIGGSRLVIARATGTADVGMEAPAAEGQAA